MSADHPGAAASPPRVPDCHDEVCVTCSDQAVPVRVRRLLGDGLALADTGAGVEEISVALVEAGVGDLVLVHAGEAIARLGEGDGDEPR
ncbi:HypC/HybG/HupF family hydrogenase formation chaperone [Nocardiopsis rhodophaea]|uniref:HypC/HybG/HupF family hydrogenase formation chaperone n=1 Tax=Nocardiopsis rhodophaea TaxID=280238 RepID=UPI0031D1B33A